MAAKKPAADPQTGLTPYGGGSGTSAVTGNTNAASGTTPAAGTPSGPTNVTSDPTSAAPGAVTVPNIIGAAGNYPQLPPNISSQVLPGGSRLGATPTTVKSGSPYQEKVIVDELAKELKVKAGKQGLETAVIEALAKQHGVHIPKPDQTEGTGTGQGSVGQARHTIASWFSTAISEVHPFADTNQDQGGPPGTAEPVESKKALNEMLTKVADELGIEGPGQKGLGDIAAAEGLPVASPTTETPGSAGGPQTVGQAYQAFLASAATSSKTGVTISKVGQAMAQDLVNANIIDESQVNSLQAIAGGYAQVLTEAAQTNQSTTAVLSAKAAQPQNVGQAQSEWASYVGGVASEFGVYLTDAQVNTIATEYYNQALAAGVTSVASGPGAVTDAIKNSVVSLYDPNNPNDPAGVASQMYQGIKAAALSYGIPLGDSQLGQYVKSSLQGQTVASMYTAKQSAIDQYTTLFQNQAASMYPSIASQIQAGIPTSTIVQPYNSITQSITGKDANAIVTSPTDQFSAFLQGGKDPKTGAPSMMTLDQWKQTLMSDPSYGFQNTQGGRNLASQFASAILNEFGKVNTGSSQQGAFSAISQSSALSANS